MPNYKGHLWGGFLLSGMVLFPLLYFHLIPSTWWLIVSLLVAGLLGSLFPDVDTKSKGQRIFYYVLSAVFFILAVQGQYKFIVMLMPVALLPVLVHHRGLFHRAWFILLFVGFTTLYACISWPGLKDVIVLNSLFFILGALSHLYLDLGWRRMFKW
jgi:hypothetical protein